MLFLDTTPTNISFFAWYPPMVFLLGCLMLVSFIGIHTYQTCMGSENLVAMGPTVVVWIRSERLARRMVNIATALLSLFLKQISDLLDGICLFLQILVQTYIGFSECCHYTTMHSSDRGQV